MPDEQKGEKKQQLKINVAENAATEYGLEGHEATQQDPRVNEMRRADSQLAKRRASETRQSRTNGLLIPSPIGAKKTPELEKPAPNAALTYGLEDRKANQADPRVTQIRNNPGPTDAPPTGLVSKLRSSLRRNSTPSETSPTSPPTTSTPPPPPPPPPPPTVTSTPQTTTPPAIKTQPQSKVLAPPAQKTTPHSTPPESTPSSTRYQTSYDSSVISTQPGQKSPSPTVPSTAPPPPPPPTAADAAPGKQKKKTQGINKFTNTDVSFDPSKEFASKTTNTEGQMYSEEESDHPAPIIVSLPPIKPTVTIAQNLDDCFVFAVDLVRRAGTVALAANKAKQRLSYTTKEHDHDLHTRTDNEVEEMIVKEINSKYPTHKIIAEEAVSRSETGKVTLTDEATWIIDPIDGTMNFVHHFPYYCISVALLIKKETVFGIVYNPPLQEMYTARAGKGAKLNEEPMHTSKQEELRNAMILQEYSSGMHEARTATALENANRLIKKTHALRSIGSSAMGLAMVASGVADGFYFFGLHVWDMAAGNLLVTEAGGAVMDPAGGPVDLMSRRVLAAATETLAYELSGELIQNYPKPRDDESKLASPVLAPLPLVAIPPPAPPLSPILPPISPPGSEPAPEPTPTENPLKKDFNAQTEFSDSTMSLSSSESRQSVVKK